MQINRISYNLNSTKTRIQEQNRMQQAKNLQNSVSFEGSDGKFKSKYFEPVQKFAQKLTNPIFEWLARFFGKRLSSDKFKKVVELAKNEKFGSPVKHFSAFIGLIIAATYIKRTLSNDKLEPEKRTTLAINQGIVAFTATVLGYVITKAIGKKVDKVVNRFEAVSVKEGLKNLVKREDEVKNLLKYKDGIKAASDMMVFGLIYRFISPVVVTPIANHIGNKIQEKKEKEMAGVK